MRVSVVLLVLVLCVGGAQANASRHTLDRTLTPAQVQKAKKQLASLTVKVAGPMVTYERGNFGARGRTPTRITATRVTTSFAAEAAQEARSLARG
jgi:hypothetical protein